MQVQCLGRRLTSLQGVLQIRKLACWFYCPPIHCGKDRKQFSPLQKSFLPKSGILSSASRHVSFLVSIAGNLTLPSIPSTKQSTMDNLQLCLRGRRKILIIRESPPFPVTMDLFAHDFFCTGTSIPPNLPSTTWTPVHRHRSKPSGIQ